MFKEEKIKVVHLVAQLRVAYVKMKPFLHQLYVGKYQHALNKSNCFKAKQMSFVLEMLNTKMLMIFNTYNGRTHHKSHTVH